MIIKGESTGYPEDQTQTGREVVEIDFRLGVRNRKKQRAYETERREQQQPGTSNPKQKPESDTETVIIGNPIGSHYTRQSTQENSEMNRPKL